MQKNPRLTALELKNLHPELLKNVAVRTMQHRLQKGLGLPSRKAAKKLLLTERMKKQRIAFAKKIHSVDACAVEKRWFRMRVIVKCYEWDPLSFDALMPLIDLTLGSQSRL